MYQLKVVAKLNKMTKGGLKEQREIFEYMRKNITGKGNSQCRDPMAADRHVEEQQEVYFR